MSNHQQVSSRDRATGQAQPGPQPRTAPMGDGANGDCGADYEDSSPERSGGHDDAPDHRAGVDAGPVSRQAPQPAPRRLLHGIGSFLAGERWSDHPACTHPLLADLARLVNDSVTDRLRPRLIPLIPSVIGLTSDDVHVDAAIALRSALAALPIAAAPRQNVLATAVIRCEHVLAELDGRDRDSLSAQSRQVLDQVPEAGAWARSCSSGLRASRRTFRAQIAPHILDIAVEGIALACAPDVEQRLVDLLAATIADCQALILTDAAPKHWVAAEFA